MINTLGTLSRHLKATEASEDTDMKNLIRRLKIALKREHLYRKRNPRPLYDKVLFAAMLAGSFTAYLLCHALVAMGIFVGGVVTLTVSSAYLWRKGRRFERGYFFARLLLAGILIAPAAALAIFIYQSSGLHLEEQQATDAYIQEHSEAMTRNVEHFVGLYEADKLRVNVDSEGKAEADAMFATMFRFGLNLRHLLGQISLEDAQRNIMWQMGDAVDVYGTSIKGPISEFYPLDATHPPILGLTCIERSDGHIATFPLLLGLPSHETEREDFVSHGEVDGEPVDPPGKIMAPFPFGLDVSTLDFMQPAAE